MNILFLSAGEPKIDASDAYPTALVEINGVPLIQRQLEQCAQISGHQLILAIREKELRRYHLEKVVQLIDADAKVVPVQASTKGAACTALLAAALIDNDTPLLILNGDEFLDVPFAEILDLFASRELDGGTLTFKSVHPRYSFVRLDEQGMVIEAIEKNPISDNATAGFYYFRKGREFVEAAKSAIRKDARHNDMFYICPVFNELILAGKSIGTYPISIKDFHPIKSNRQLNEFSSFASEHA